MIEHGELDWLSSEGGPLLLLSQEHLHRACDVNQHIAQIPVGPHTGLVINWDYPTAWLPTAQGGLLLRETIPEEELLSILRSIPDKEWQLTELTVHVEAGPLIVFDSAFPGNMVQDALRLSLPAGDYRVETVDSKIAGQNVLLHRLVSL